MLILSSTLTDVCKDALATAAELTETFLRGRRAELHQVLQVRLLRGDLEVADVTVSLWRRQKVSVTRCRNQVGFSTGTHWYKLVLTTGGVKLWPAGQTLLHLLYLAHKAIQNTPRGGSLVLYKHLPLILQGSGSNVIFLLRSALTFPARYNMCVSAS